MNNIDLNAIFGEKKKTSTLDSNSVSSTSTNKPLNSSQNIPHNTSNNLSANKQLNVNSSSTHSNNQQIHKKQRVISEAVIEELLLEKKIITRDQLDVAYKEKKDTGSSESIGAILVKMGLITDSMLSEVILEQSGNQDFDLKSAIIDQKLVHKIPKGFALQNKVIPISVANNTITVAISDLYDIVTIDQIKQFFPSHYKINPVFASEIDIMKAINQYYDYEMSIDGILREIEEEKSDIDDQESLQGSYKSPMVRLVDALLTDAVKSGASDLHFEPEDFFLRLRYRIDGRMEQIRTFHNKYWSSIVVRIKILSGMNIAETRKPQDGRIQATILGRKVDFRVSTQPTVAGENIVMRILDQKQSINNLSSLGFTDNHIAIINKCLKRPDGIIILTGPTGSGKTTTLYTMLNMINNIDINVMTLENPVEYRIPLIRQSNINTDIGATFADGIRTLLRQDPDVILVGEIRDEETAIAAVQASMTGHQVFSSLHTNDALSTIPRLLQIGVKSYLLSGSLIAIVAQRLTRSICPHCKTEYPITEEEKIILTKILGEEEVKNVTKLYKGTGCEKCKGKGYTKRVAVVEVLDVDKEIDDMIVREARKKEIFDYLKTKNYVTMQIDGARKVIQGVTTLDELIRCVDMTDYLDVKI